MSNPDNNTKNTRIPKMIYFIPLYLLLRETILLKVIFFDFIFSDPIKLLSTPGYHLLKISGILFIIYSLFLTSLLIICWIGILKLREWARKGLVIYCWLAILNGIGNIVMRSFFVSTIPPDERMIQNIEPITRIIIELLIIFYFSRSKIKKIFTSTESKIYYFG